MTRTLVALGLVAALAACGGSRGSGGSGGSSGGSGGTAPSKTYAMFAKGPIYDACLEADRKRASRPLCGCIQAAANNTFNARERAKIVTFFEDPHQSQVTRQSDKASDEAFWPRYRAWANKTTKTCS